MRTTLGSHDTTLFQRGMNQFEIRLLEQALCRSHWVTTIGDDNIELVLAVCEEFEAIADMGLHIRVLEAD